MNQKELSTSGVDLIEQTGTALSFLLFPLFFVAAQIMHPNLFHIEMITEGKQWIEHFRGQNLLHFAHLLEFLCAPLLIIMALHYKKILRKKVPILSFIGVCMVFIGALMLLGNKSALCLTISAFDTLNDQQLYQLVPGLNMLLRKEGIMAVLWLLPLLPLGYVLIAVSLFRSNHVPKWQSVLLVIGSLLLANPEIEIVNFFASFFLAAGLIPYSIKLFKQISFSRE
ncbi:MAG: DUF4386 family protein [Spirochaetales bacterium]|nr:DUF4386 family protein [Spirochaetales bacterium]